MGRKERGAHEGMRWGSKDTDGSRWKVPWLAYACGAYARGAATVVGGAPVVRASAAVRLDLLGARLGTLVRASVVAWHVPCDVLPSESESDRSAVVAVAPRGEGKAAGTPLVLRATFNLGGSDGCEPEPYP